MCTDPCITNAINAHRPEVTGCYSQRILEISSALLCAWTIFGRNVRGPFFPPPILYSRIPRPRMFLKCVWVRSEDICLSPSFNLSRTRQRNSDRRSFLCHTLACLLCTFPNPVNGKRLNGEYTRMHLTRLYYPIRLRERIFVRILLLWPTRRSKE